MIIVTFPPRTQYIIGIFREKTTDITNRTIFFLIAMKFRIVALVNGHPLEIFCFLHFLVTKNVSQFHGICTHLSAFTRNVSLVDRWTEESS